MTSRDSPTFRVKLASDIGRTGRNKSFYIVFSILRRTDWRLRVLRETWIGKGYFGTPNVNFTVSSTVFNPAHVHTFNSVKDLEQEVGDARIYAGFHYHHSVVQGFALGQHVAQEVLVNFFQPVASQ
jgi:hypothetical protein